MRLSGTAGRGIARLLLVLLSVALVLGVAEGVARVTWPERNRPERREQDDDLPKLSGLVALSQPNVRGRHVGVLYRTNSHAIRGPEIPIEAAPGVLRIAITGDSVTAGWGVEENATYARVLEQALTQNPIASAPAHQRYEVLNFGMAGLNTRSAIERLEQKSQIFHPRIAVYGFTVNDIEGPAYRASDLEVDAALAKRYRKYRFAKSHLLRVLWPNLIALREWIQPLPGSQLEAFYYNYFENPRAFGDLDRALEQFAKWGESENVCTHVLLHTQLTNLGPFHVYHPMYRAVTEAAQRHGLGVTSSFSRFSGTNATRFWIHLWDAHPNPSGHRILAEALEEGLRGLPASCWFTRDADATPPTRVRVLRPD